MKKVLALVLALGMLLCLAACGGTTSAESTETTPVKFIMGIDAEYPPFSYLGDDGEYTGFDVEICRAACELLGYEMEIFGVNWDEKLIQLDAKECDCVWSGMTIMDTMKEAGYVISTPYFDNTQVILVKAGSAITCAADLAGKVVAVQLGTSGESLLTDEEGQAALAATFAELKSCDSFLKCFTELDGNAVDAVVVDRPVAQSYVNEHEGFVILDETLGSEQYGIAFRSGDEALCQAIEGAVAQLVANGTYQTIADKYPDIDQNSLAFLR